MSSDDSSGTRLTVAICTHNRSELLRRCLEALAAQDGVGQCLIEVVDNASTDDTRALCACMLGLFPKFKYLYEPAHGVSAARNRAIAECDSEFLAYLDDDAVVDPGWVNGMLHAFRETGADVIGGPIIPYWDGHVPWWVSEPLLPFFSRLYRGEGVMVDDEFRPFGGNMAFRTSVLKSCGSFDARLGVTAIAGKQVTVHLGEETELVNRIVGAGHRVAYSGDASVRHLTHGTMRGVRGVRKRAMSIGRTAAILGSEVGHLQAREDEWAWSIACVVSSLARLRFRDAVAFYLSSVVSLALLRESNIQKGKRFGAAMAILRSVMRLRRGLAGLAKSTLVGSPPRLDPESCETERSAIHRA